MPARQLAAGIAEVPGVEPMFPVEANAVFLSAAPALLEALRARGWRFYTFIGGGARFMFSWDSRAERVDALARDIRACADRLAS